MKAAVLHINTARYDSDAPTMRIARFVAEQLGVPLIHDVPTAAAHARTRFDVLFVKYGILKFSQHRDHALEIYSRAKRIIDLQNDYLMEPDSRFKKANASREVWGTVPDVCDATGGAYVNWNMLTWHAAPPSGIPRYPGLFYYGAFRQGRADALRCYYGAGVPYHVTISTNARNKAKFAELNPDATLLPKLDTAGLAHGGMTVYMEDAASHDRYCSLANRFYECLSLGIAMVFDTGCVQTLDRAELRWWRQFAVSVPYEVDELLPRAGRIATAQRTLWGEVDYGAKLQRDLRRVARSRLGWQFAQRLRVS